MDQRPLRIELVVQRFRATLMSSLLKHRMCKYANMQMFSAEGVPSDYAGPSCVRDMPVLRTLRALEEGEEVTWNYMKFFR